MVGKFACLFQTYNENKEGIIVDKTNEAEDIICLLKKYRFRILTKKEMLVSMDINFAGNGTLVYNILFDELDSTNWMD